MKIMQKLNNIARESWEKGKRKMVGERYENSTFELILYFIERVSRYSVQLRNKDMEVKIGDFKYEHSQKKQCKFFQKWKILLYLYGIELGIEWEETFTFHFITFHSVYYFYIFKQVMSNLVDSTKFEIFFFCFFFG